DPAPDGSMRTQGQAKWSWSDVSGTGRPTPGEIRWAQPLGKYATTGMDVDAQGNIWFADQETESVWEIPLGPLDARGNPTYDWSQARQVIARDTSPLGFLPRMAQHADDGSTYVFGWTKDAPQGDSPFWMGGAVLARFDAQGRRSWVVTLPETSTGMDVIPG